MAIVNECFKHLPDAVAWKLSRQLYLEYFWDGDKYKIKNNITGEELYFTSYVEIVSYLRKLGYTTNPRAICDAFNRHSLNYCNHAFLESTREKEITYFE